MSFVLAIFLTISLSNKRPDFSAFFWCVCVFQNQGEWIESMERQEDREQDSCLLGQFLDLPNSEEFRSQAKVKESKQKQRDQSAQRE